MPSRGFKLEVLRVSTSTSPTGNFAIISGKVKVSEREKEENHYRRLYERSLFVLNAKEIDALCHLLQEAKKEITEGQEYKEPIPKNEPWLANQIKASPWIKEEAR
jgi:hypothetical protein